MGLVPTVHGLGTYSTWAWYLQYMCSYVLLRFVSEFVEMQTNSDDCIVLFAVLSRSAVHSRAARKPDHFRFRHLTLSYRTVGLTGDGGREAKGFTMTP